MARELSTLENRKWQHIMNLIASMGDRWARFAMVQVQERSEQRSFALQQEELRLRRETQRNDMKLKELQLVQQGKTTEAEFRLRMNELGMRQEEFMYSKEMDVKKWAEDVRRWNAENAQRAAALKLNYEAAAREAEDHFMKVQQDYERSIIAVQGLAQEEKPRMMAMLESLIGDPILDPGGNAVLRPDGTVARKLKKWVRDGLHGERGGRDNLKFRDALKKTYGDIDMNNTSGYEAFRTSLESVLTRLAIEKKPATWENVLKLMPGGEDFALSAAGLDSYKRAQAYWDRTQDEAGGFVQDQAEDFGTASRVFLDMGQKQLAVAHNLSLARGEILKLQSDPDRGKPGWQQKFLAVMAPINEATNNYKSSVEGAFTDLSKIPESGGYSDDPKGTLEGDPEAAPRLKPSAQVAADNVQKSWDRAKASVTDPTVLERIDLHFGAQMESIKNAGKLETGEFKSYSQKVADLVTAQQAQNAILGRGGKLTNQNIGNILRMAGPIPGGLDQPEEDLTALAGMLPDERFLRALLSQRSSLFSSRRGLGIGGVGSAEMSLP